MPPDAGEATNVAVAESLWAALGRRDFAAVGEHMSMDGHYVDVPVKDVDEGARGPLETAARVRLGLEPLLAYELHDGPVVATGDFVVTEHAETWIWEPNVSVRLPFTSVMEVRDGKVDRWWDYFDLNTLMAGAPAWWVEHVLRDTSDSVSTPAPAPGVDRVRQSRPAPSEIARERVCLGCRPCTWGQWPSAHPIDWRW